jgi:hypothetical protein
MKFLQSIPFVLVFLAFSCSTPKTDQSGNPDSLSATYAFGDSLDTPTALSPPIQTDSNTQVLLLKWDEINMSEYGPAFVFEDQGGNHVFIQFIETPGFDFQKNEYFEAVYRDENMFPTITLRKEVIGKWYRATIKNELRELVGAEGEVSVITTLESVQE